jgi:hypothetical protein
MTNTCDVVSLQFDECELKELAWVLDYLLEMAAADGEPTSVTFAAERLVELLKEQMPVETIRQLDQHLDEHHRNPGSNSTVWTTDATQRA